MKTASDPRHKKRQKIIQELFEWNSHKLTAKGLSERPPKLNKYDPKTVKIIGKISAIDKEIETHATKWPKDKINMIDIAILRLAVYELQFDKSVPPKAVIDEAVELAKEFGADSSSEFVNGVLGQVFKK